MRTIIWSQSAVTDLERNFRFIAAQDSRAAEVVAGRIVAAIDSLAKRPIGRPSRLPDLYEKRVLKTKFVIVYDVAESAGYSQRTG